MDGADSWPILSHQPLRLIFKLYRISAILARLPLWLVGFALFRSLRPRPQWTLWQSIMARLIRLKVDMDSRVGISDPLSLKPGPEKDRFQLIKPAPRGFYRGPLESSVAPATIGGTWYPKVLGGQDLGPDGVVVVHFHGGAFVTGDGRTASLGFLSNTLLRHAKVDAVFAPQYRLSGYAKTNPFPAALQDAVTSYFYLIQTLKIPAGKIVVSGDSAGGNLTIAFLRYLAEHGEQTDMPKPLCAVLLSPWVSPLNSLGPEIHLTSNPNYSTDILPHEFTRWGAKTYAGIVDVADPYITPLGKPFATPVPIFVNQGACEILEIDGTQWVKEMLRIEGNKIQSEYEAGAPHDTLLIGDRAGWKASAERVAAHVGAFIRANRQASRAGNSLGKL